MHTTLPKSQTGVELLHKAVVETSQAEPTLRASDGRPCGSARTSHSNAAVVDEQRPYNGWILVVDERRPYNGWFW